jgi:hypothetical protein
LALSVALPVSVNVHVFVLLPPLEQAPDQITSRPLETLSVICVPVANVADPLPSTMTLMPAGLEVTRSSLRPLVVTVSVAVCPGGGAGVTVSVAVLVAPPYDAVIVTGVEALTAAVGMAKFAVVLPAAIVTLAGTVAAVVLLLDSVMTAPPDGAALVSLAVPCEAAPPVTLVGFTETDESDAGGGGGETVNAALLVAPPNEPEIVTGVDEATGCVVTVNVLLVLPAATVTLAGTVATAVLLLDIVTTAPPLGAAALSVTVPVEELPPTAVVGLTVTEESVAEGGGGFTPSDAKSVVSTSLAESWTVVAALGNVVIVKLALVAPAATVTLAGTLAEPGRLLVRLTDVPPDGAALGRVTVPVAGLPPTTLVGLTLNEERVAGGGGVPAGFTVRSAERVTPPPVTEIVTMVCTETAAGEIWINPLVLPAGITTLPDRKGNTLGLLLVT